MCVYLPSIISLCTFQPHNTQYHVPASLARLPHSTLSASFLDPYALGMLLPHSPGSSSLPTPRKHRSYEQQQPPPHNVATPENNGLIPRQPSEVMDLSQRRLSATRETLRASLAPSSTGTPSSSSSHTNTTSGGQSKRRHSSSGTVATSKHSSRAKRLRRSSAS